MHVFVTGASGWIGSATVDELLAAGHAVTGLVRSDASASALRARGATALRGDLDDLAVLRRGAQEADGVVHLANKHDWADPAGTARAERAAVQALGDALVGSDRPLLVAAGVAGLATGRPATEADATPFTSADSPRGGSEHLALTYADRGVRAVALRFAPTVHGAGDHGFVAVLAQRARETGLAGHPGDGSNRWAAVHRGDAARLVALALEQAPAGTRVHAVAEEGVPTREIAEALGRSLGVPAGPVAPEDAEEQFGWLARFFGADLAASSAATRERFGWRPTGPSLVEDVDAGGYR